MTDLLAPLRFPNGATAPNRIWLAPLTNQQSAADGTLSPEELRWLLCRAEGGFGVIESCAAWVSPAGQAWPGELGVASAAHEVALRPLGAGLRARGAVGLVQLFHGGARASRALTGLPTWSACTWQEESPGFEPPQAASEPDILGVVEDFRQAALRCARAGLHGVELHGAHGYLLGQFLSATQNPRTDGWGGDLCGRARLLRAVLRAVRQAVPADFVVGVRISPEDRGQAVGLDLDESLQLAAWLAEDGVDFLHLSLWEGRQPTRKRPDRHPIPLFREAVGPALPIVACGGVWTREDARFLVEQGADAVALGRAAIGDPEWPQRVAAGGGEPLRPPFTHDQLVTAEVSEPFRTYLGRFRGLTI